MDTADLHSLVEDLTSNIDDLEESLAPLLKTALSHSTSKLPLLDKAKLYVLATYAIESILFSYLRLNGVEAKDHPVFQELARVKEYFAKIKTAETAGMTRNTTLDKDAASRFIKHGLAGNEKYDRERAERITKEKAGAKRKLEDIAVGTHTRFDGAAKRIKAAELDTASGRGTDDERTTGRGSRTASTATSDVDTSDAKSVKRKAKDKKRSKMRRAAAAGANELEAEINQNETHSDGGVEIDVDDVESTSTKSPKSSKEEVDALFQDSTPKKPKKKRKRPKNKEQREEDARADEMR